MAKMHALTALQVKSLPAGRHNDGGGLYLTVRKDLTRSWVFRYTIHSRSREMGLGPFPAISLKDAREQAENLRAKVKLGIDPIQEREQAANENVKALHTLADITEDAFNSRKAELKGDGKAGRWLTPLALHVLPKIGSLPIGDITPIVVRDVLKPIWHDKAATAIKAANRLHIVLEHADDLELPVNLQAVKKAKKLLGKQRHTETPLASMRWQDVPEFFQSLPNSYVGAAIKLIILTASRATPVRLATADQFDLDAGVWIIPADHLKGRLGATSDFRVPLSDLACELVKDTLPVDGGLLFKGARNNAAVSDAALSKYFRDRGIAATPHGFRSSFRSWAADMGQPWEVAETALGHTVGNRVERSYQRSDMLERRRAMMQAWADHVKGQTGAKVMPFAKAMGLDG